ncbi:NADH dehydrogenase [ubiquinone] 1 alpha subcomplex subunit 5-like [Artibeus jamaicensis]|uniref:NADH dehydrogenase [ubiquinone] 1 alpha subcomplex subunit 5-like n=1 Tax=Artibeus jamaicensis TaxID=9417 RepID=UPI00235AE221|nr:NADH dehydrogenase [ubiquinone] 1 alpha subcomplex subunit 5-like [Artibeus jamaicensis]
MEDFLKKTTDLVGLAVCATEPDVKKLEDLTQGGQIEEVILQAENELSLAGKMMPWKPWETLVEGPPPGRWKWPIKSLADGLCVEGKLMSLNVCYIENMSILLTSNNQEN